MANVANLRWNLQFPINIQNFFRSNFLATLFYLACFTWEWWWWGRWWWFLFCSRILPTKFLNDEMMRERKRESAFIVSICVIFQKMAKVTKVPSAVYFFHFIDYIVIAFHFCLLNFKHNWWKIIHIYGHFNLCCCRHHFSHAPNWIRCQATGHESIFFFFTTKSCNAELFC